MATSIRSSRRLENRDLNSSLSALPELDGGFYNILRHSMTQVLEDVLGKAALGVLVAHYRLDDLARSPEKIHEVLWTVFTNGAVVLEKLIVKDLFREVGMLREEDGDFDFGRFVAKAREGLNGTVRRQK